VKALGGGGGWGGGGGGGGLDSFQNIFITSVGDEVGHCRQFLPRDLPFLSVCGLP